MLYSTDTACNNVTSSNVQFVYDSFLSVVCDLIAYRIPTKLVTMGHRDPPFVTKEAQPLEENRAS